MKKVITVLLLIVCLITSFALFAGCNNNSDGIKNVIIFIGDGMGFNHIYNAQKYFDDASIFEYSQYFAGTVTTHSLDNDTTDSAAAASALATGNKVNNGNVARLNGTDLTSIMTIAQQNGKKTGIITSDYLYGATPAGYSSHADNRKNYDSIVEKQAECGIDLLVGDRDKGGYYRFHEDEFFAENYAIISDFEELLATPSNQKVIANLKGLRSKYNENIENNTIDFTQLLKYSFDYLNNENGFCLMVENAYIDKCSHDNEIYDAMCEVRAFYDAIEATLKYFEGRKDTVIIVTADHETGGLALADSKEEITNDLYSRTSHSNANVPLYVFGYDTGVEREYDNIEIFELCKALIVKGNATAN